MEIEDVMMRNQHLKIENDMLKALIDDLRREICLWQGLDTNRTSEEVARVRGWDCFNKKEINSVPAQWLQDLG